MMRVIPFFMIFILFFCSCERKDKKAEGTQMDAHQDETVTKTTMVSIDATGKAEPTEASLFAHPITDGTIPNIINEYPIEQLLMGLIEKNEDKLWSIGYIEGANGFLYSVDFESYEIVSCSETVFFNSSDICYDYWVELNISKSKDERFPIGKSMWNIGLSNMQYCYYFLPESFDKNNISAYWQNKSAMICSYFSFSFNDSNTVKDISKYIISLGQENLVDSLRAFIIGVNPQIGNGGEVFVTKSQVNEILEQYFEISDYMWSDEFLGIHCDSNWWQMRTVFALLNEQTEEYIDVIYYADFAYITPAMTIRYFLNQNDNNIQLMATELLCDYGYEPFTDLF
jgi:hypothetical protein